MRHFALGTVVILSLLALVSFANADSIVFGPEIYDRTEGAPDVYNENFYAVPGVAFLVVFNGDDEQDSRVSSGSIFFNGVEVVAESDLNQQVERIIRPLALLSNNSMEITLNGQPGGYITVLIITDKKMLPEFTYGRLHLAWTSIADPSETVQLRLKNGAFYFDRSYKIRFYNEDGTLAAVSGRMQLAPHASLNAIVQSFLPEGSTWQTGSLEILFAGKGGARVLGYALQTNGAAQTVTVVPLQYGGIRHLFGKIKQTK
jgi:hypothetical protein